MQINSDVEERHAVEAVVERFCVPSPSAKRSRRKASVDHGLGARPVGSVCGAGGPGLVSSLK